MKRNKVTISRTGQSLASAITIGILVTSVLSLLLSVLASYFVINGSLQENRIFITVFSIRLISVLLGALVAGAIFKRSYLPLVGTITGGYLLVLISVGGIICGGDFQQFLSGVVSVSIGGIAALLILQRPRKTGNKSSKYSL